MRQLMVREIGRWADAPSGTWRYRWWLRSLAVRRWPVEWWCKLRGGHIYERFYGDRYPPRPGRFNGYQCARCFHTVHIYSDGSD